MLNAILMSIVTILGVCFTAAFIDCFIDINPESSYRSYYKSCRPSRPTFETKLPKRQEKEK